MLPTSLTQANPHPSPHHSDHAWNREAEAPAIVGAEYRSLVYVLGYCAIRAGEIVALRRKTVSMMRNESRIFESATEVRGAFEFGTTKNRQNRTVTLPRLLVELLEEHLSDFTDSHPDALVFSAPGGEPLQLSGFEFGILPLRAQPLKVYGFMISVTQVHRF